MKEQPVTDALLRQFLLGHVDDKERQRIETLFMTDLISKERILAAEQDLIEDYLEDSLDIADKNSFLLHYAETSAQQRKLRIMKSVKDWAVREANVSRVSPPPISIWNRLLTGLKLKPVFVIPIAVTAVIAITIAAFWLNRNAEQRGIEQEIAQLNLPASLLEALPQMTSRELVPVAVRSVEQGAELTIPEDIRVVELRLAWIQKENYPSYRALIQRVGDNKSLTIDNLHADGDSGKFIPMRLPASILKRGLYRIELTGINAGGAVGTTEEYNFTVSG